METDSVIEEAVSNFVETELTDEQIEAAGGVLAGGLAARSFAAWTGSTYEEDSN